MSEYKIINLDVIDALKGLSDKSIDCCITSPPYFGLRDYGVDGQIGLEATPEDYVKKLVEVFREVRRVLKDDGTLWLNLGDCYAGSGKGAAQYPDLAIQTKQGTNKGMLGAKKVLEVKTPHCKPKDLIGIPWKVAFALQSDGWYLRSDIIWHKPNAMPESVKDRPTRSHEYVFLLAKQKKYYYDNEAIDEPANYDGRKDTYHKGSIKYSETDIMPGHHSQILAKRPHERWRTKDGVRVRNKRDVWTIPVKPYKGAHFATFPENLVKPCILAGSRKNGIVLDPFSGSGTTGVVSIKNGRKFIGIELNPEYARLSEERISEVVKKTSVVNNQVCFENMLKNV